MPKERCPPVMRAGKHQLGREPTRARLKSRAMGITDGQAVNGAGLHAQAPRNGDYKRLLMLPLSRQP